MVLRRVFEHVKRICRIRHGQRSSQRIRKHHSKSGGFQQDPSRFRPFSYIQKQLLDEIQFFVVLLLSIRQQKAPQVRKFHARSLGVDLGCQLLTVNGKKVRWEVRRRIHNHSVSQIAMGCNEKFLVRDFNGKTI